MLNNILVYFFIFLIGLSLGSFANVVIDRLPKSKPLTGRSHCDLCNRTLSPLDLIPLISFLVLRGRCRYCKKKIPKSYFLVELATGVIILSSFLLSSQYYNGFFPGIISSVYAIAIVYIFWLIFLIDIKDGIIPTKLVIAGIIIVLFYYLFTLIYSGSVLYSFLASERSELGNYLMQTGFLKNRLILLTRPLISGLGSGSVLSLVFYLIVLITKGRGMGGGDVRLAFLIGLMLGPAKTIVGVFISFLTGSLIAVILILMKKKTFGQTVPFGPFLALGSLTSLFFGSVIWNWYLSTLG